MVKTFSFTLVLFIQAISFAQSSKQVVSSIKAMQTIGTQAGSHIYECNQPQDEIIGTSFHFRRCYVNKSDGNSRLVTYTLDPKRSDIKVKLKTSLEAEGTTAPNAFLMNGPMFNPDMSPVGLIIRDGIRRNPLNSNEDGKGNFFEHHDANFENNGVIVVFKNGDVKFFTRSEAISKLDPANDSQIKMAFQGGPIMVKDGKVNSIFKEASANVLPRSAVCITENKKLRFMHTNTAMGMNFYGFANAGLDSPCIEDNAGNVDKCVHTLYVDGSNGVVDSNFPRGGLISNSDALKNVFVISAQ